MKVRLGYLLLLVLLGFGTPVRAQIQFFEGDFEAALKKAQAEKKNLFVDFYAVWCGPCKVMSSEVFTKPEVGDYFNERFVCCQVDAEKNRELAKKYGVDAFPSLLFINGKGEVLRKAVGSMAPDGLIREAKIALGEALSFEQMYDKYKKNKKDWETVQGLLQDAPAFVPSLRGFERDKWIARVESLFPEYVKNKKLENMINATDLAILQMYHPQREKADPIFDFLVTRFDQYAEVVGKTEISQYLIAMNNGWIIQLCKKGNQDYKKSLDQLNGDLEKAYSGIKFGQLSVKEAITYLADATYYLYRGNDDRFFENMDKYFAGVGENLTLNDYTQPLEDLYTVHEGKLTPHAQGKCIDWIAKALELNPEAQLRTRLLIIMGECYVGVGEPGKAKQALNQAFISSAQIEDKGMMIQLQQVIQDKLNNL